MKRLKESDIELVIVDLDYHTNDILDFVTHLRTSMFYQDMQIVALASQGQWAEGDEVVFNIDKFFLKPFGPDELVRGIKELMLTPAKKVI